MASGLTGLTYSELAQRYGVDLCRGECAERGHREGFLAYGRLHFAERGVTRSGLRRFLMLVFDLTAWWETPRSARSQPAEWIHKRNVFAQKTAYHDLGVRLPRSLAKADRARVRHLAAVSKIPESAGRWARD